MNVVSCGPGLILLISDRFYSVLLHSGVRVFLFTLIFSQFISLCHSLQDIKNAQNLVELLQDMILALNPRDRMVCISPFTILWV